MRFYEKTFKVKIYRYIYPLHPKFQSKFKEQPYPIYEKGEHNFKWVRDTAKIKENIIMLLGQIA